MENLKELNSSDLKKISGGDFGASVGLGLAVLGAAIYVYNNADDFIDGLQAGWNAHQAASK